MNTIILNTRILTPSAALDGHAIVMHDSKITDIVPVDQLALYPCDRVIDGQGAYASAGWIDLHTHGICGYDFMDAQVEGACSAMQAYARHGVTGVFPTTMSAPYAQLRQALDALSKTDFSAAGGACFLGAHIEGPYFSPEQCGAQPPSELRLPEDGEYKSLIQEYPFVRRVDGAPELAGAFDMARELTRHGLICGIAHTNADAKTVLAAIGAGYSIATHLYSGMSGVHRENGYRIAGAVEACLLQDDVYCEAICDGIHLPTELLQLIYKVKGPERMILVTDSMRGAGLPDGTRCMLGHEKTGTPAVVSEGVAWLPDRSAFAGSVATFDRLICTARDAAHIPLLDVVKMASTTPAKAMGLRKKGILAPGYDADITIFNEDIKILYTIVGGKIQYAAQEKENVQ